MMSLEDLQIENMEKHDQEWLIIHAFTLTEYEKQNGVYAIRIGANIAMPNYHIGPRVTPYYYLLCVLEGEGFFTQQGKTYTLQKNDIFCLFPQVIHEYYCHPNKPIKKLILAFSGKQALQTLAQIGLTPEQPHRVNRVNSRTINAFFHFFQAHQHPLVRLNGLFSIFESLVYEDVSHVTSSNQLDDWLIKGKHYIEHYFSESITVEQVADKVGIERTHFSKMFTKRFNIAPVQYILQLKMDEASLLLQHTNYQIIEIAQAVGYQDISSFSKAFKRKLGLSPVLYRQHYLKNSESVNGITNCEQA